MISRELKCGILVGFFLAGCAGAAYQTYGLEIPDGCYKAGHLLAHEASGDLPLTVCQPDPAPSPGASPGAVVSGKCRILKEAEFVRLESDLVTCQTELKGCQENCH